MRNVDPFLDHRLVELMFGVPGSMKIRDGVTKRLLREATAGLLPEETRTRIKKTGWNAPADRWFSGPGRAHRARADRVARVPRARHLRRRRGRGGCSTSTTRSCRPGRPAENHMMFFWQLVNLELWLRSLDELP